MLLQPLRGCRAELLLLATSSKQQQQQQAAVNTHKMLLCCLPTFQTCLTACVAPRSLMVLVPCGHPLQCVVYMVGQCFVFKVRMM
mmetsp:Transcript_43986/g.74176  ORF Transcript_43986/g.74176 Transcript_43986/m.74176 type:complete len:85 (-) Transcript_43986:2180-2434(-)